MRQIIPFYLLILHQNFGNSVFGLGNGRLAVSLLLQVLLIMVVFLLLDKKFSYLRLIVLGVLGIAVGLWSAYPDNFKLVGTLYVILFVSYYVTTLNGFRIIKRHLMFVVIFSFLISIIQIAGISEFVHLWNSQFVSERAGYLFRETNIVNIIRIGDSDNYFDPGYFDSRQVRPPGIFHSSAVLSYSYVAYMAYIFAGFYKTKLHFGLIPWLIVFSGSKLVLFAAILMLLLAVVYGKLSSRIYLIILLNALACVAMHVLLFGTLLVELFNFDIVFASFDMRFRTYFDVTLGDFLAAIEFSEFLPYVGLIIGLGFIAHLGMRQLAKSGNSYVHYVLVIGLTAAIITTPHVGNILFGLLFLPAFFAVKQSRFAATAPPCQYEVRHLPLTN